MSGKEDIFYIFSPYEAEKARPCTLKDLKMLLMWMLFITQRTPFKLKITLNETHQDRLGLFFYLVWSKSFILQSPIG